MRNKKRLWVSIAVISVVLALGVGATLAYFVATRTAASNRFQVGTLDLNVDSNGQVNEPFVIENLGDNANISGTKTWTVKNTGSLPGRLLVRLQNLQNQENGCANDQEKTAEPNCDDPNKEGDLGGVITANVSLDGTDVVSSTLATANQSKIGNDWNALAPVILQPNEQRTVTVHWATAETGYGNEIQGDSLSYDLNVRLIQLINGPTPANQ
ncbi:hypothetical protein HY214_00415 [Candidatus Roizmanbacteria bacterium]|nr:hypothetical protein [Candidatus Roizmanbacteria bacterium]